MTSKNPLVAILCGWCVFLVLCSLAWIVGLSANMMRPLFWIFFATGLIVIVRERRWLDGAVALVVTGAVAGVLCVRCAREPEAFAFGAHGTDMWGYVGVAEWLYGHSTRELPDIGNSPMRFNWTWYVLQIRDRPLTYETLACLGASTGISALKAYMAWPVALMASIAMGIGRTPGVFGLRHWSLALLPAVVMVFHPLIVLHWIAGFAAGTLVGLLIALGFAALVMAEDGPARTEAVALAALLLVLCGGLYSPQFMLVGGALAGGLALVGGIFAWWRLGWRELWRRRPERFTVVVAGLASVLAIATVRLSGDEFIRSTGFAWSGEVLAQFLGIFGGTTPYAWLFYNAMKPWDQHPEFNPVGLAALVGMVVLFGAVTWERWRTARDLRVPLLIALCVAGLLRVGGDERAVMAKAMPVFGFALVILIAAISARLRPRWLGLVAAVLCVMPAVRSARELHEMIRDPYITCTVDNLRKLEDAEIWRTMGYLYLKEDEESFDWSQHPQTFFALTCYLPEPVQVKLAAKYHVVKRP